jgi:hypothetical protein
VIRVVGRSKLNNPGNPRLGSRGRDTLGGPGGVGTLKEGTVKLVNPESPWVGS